MEIIEFLKEKLTSMMKQKTSAVFVLYLLIFVVIVFLLFKIFFKLSITTESIINFSTFIAVSLTAIYVIKYWEEAQRTKEEIITQSRINFQSVKSSQLPLVVVELEYRQKCEHQNQPMYDINLNNKGNGPAFKIICRREIDPQLNQKTAIHQVAQNDQELRTFIEGVSLLGAGEKVKIWTERSASYKGMKMTVRYSDLFGDWHDIIFEGDRDGIKLINYPTLINFYDQKEWPKPKTWAENGQKEIGKT